MSDEKTAGTKGAGKRKEVFDYTLMYINTINAHRIKIAGGALGYFRAVDAEEK